MSQFLPKTLLALVLGVPTVLSAQTSSSADVFINMTILNPGVTATFVQAIDFGIQPASAVGGQVVASQWGAWSVSHSVGPGTQLQISFTLPSSVSGPQPGSELLMSYGATSASVLDQGFPVGAPFDPNVGTTFTLGGTGVGQFDVTLGQDIVGDGSGLVVADLVNAQPGIYQGVATMTVTVL